MGSFPMFALQECLCCGLSTVLPQYPHPANYCVQCNHFMCKFQINAVLGALKVGLHDLCSDPAVLLEALFHRINIPIDLVSCEVITSFLVPSIRQVQFEHSRGARYLFLKNTLLAHGSISATLHTFLEEWLATSVLAKMFLIAS